LNAETVCGYLFNTSKSIKYQQMVRTAKS